MRHLVGEDCPLLFEKWRPDEFESFFDGEPSRLSQMYDFDFASVDINSSNIYFPQHYISAHGKMYPGAYTPEALFEPKILELYIDAKEFMKQKLKEKSTLIPELALIDIEEHSKFGRCTGCHVDVEDDRPSGALDIEARNKIASEVYHSLEDNLRKEFGIVSEEIVPNYVLLVPAGDAKILTLSKGIYFMTENPLPDEVNAGTLYMRIISDENGEKEFHHNVVEFVFGYLNRAFKDRLVGNHNKDVVNLGLSGDGSAWKIDLSRIKVSPKLSEGILAGFLPE